MSTYELHAATESDIASVVSGSASEGRRLEFKRDLPTAQHNQVREFLADVSSFANSDGGHLVFGIRTERGIAVELVGLEVLDRDGETSRLENLLRTSVEPRLPSVSYHWVPLEADRWVLVMTIARSWAAPHVVNFEKHWRFYSRNATGKYPLDVHDVRSQVLLTGSATERLRRFRADRIGALKAGETPVPLMGAARLVLHLVPFLALAPDSAVTTAEMAQAAGKLFPLRHSSAGFRYNIDGIVKHASGGGSAELGYVQAFRNGALEVVEAELLSNNVRDEIPLLPLAGIEEALLGAIPDFLDYLDATHADYPVALMLSLLNVRGFVFWKDYDHFVLARHRVVVDREDLVLPDLVLQERPEPVSPTMRQLFDILWNAGGFAQSPNFDVSGDWHRP